MKTQTEIEPMATRVALHPFLAGMNHAQLALLTDCAMVVHFHPGQVIFREGELANRLYLIESGKVILESSGRLGAPRCRRYRCSRRAPRLVVDVSTVRLAFHRSRN